MYYILTQREELLKYLPKGGVGAEIGVAQGEYSAAILQSAQPAELHLIDPWSHLEAGSDLLGAVEMLGGIGHARARGDPFGAVPENREGDIQYSEVIARFEGDARVQLHRQYSYKAAASFADGYFDFVYLDGNHHYEFVLQDLHDFAAKLKPGGLLFGHDFFEDAFARDEHYGVVDAVNSFVKRSDFRFLALTAESFSTFCLARRLDGFAGEFIRNLFEGPVEILELPDALASNFRDKAFKRRDGSTKRVPSFINPSQFLLP